MIDLETAKKIANQTMVDDAEKIELIVKYLSDKGKGEIKINQPHPIDMMNYHLMGIAFNVAVEYYLKLE